MKPPFTYFGGKTGMAPRIVSLMPPHLVYMEPFAGSLAVLFAKKPSTHEIVNDIDGSLVAFWRALRDQPDELERLCALTPYARTEYLAADLDEDGLEDLELARRFWVRVNQSFAKTAGRRTGWSVTTARTQSTAGSVFARLGRFHAAAERLSQVCIESYDAAGLVDRLATAETVIYVDPPYVQATRRGQWRGTARATQDDYRHEMDEEGHRRLAESLRATKATVILSGYKGDLYEDLYGDWWRLDVPVTVHSSNARTSKRDGRVESIWSNVALGEGVMDFGGSA
ncbi:MAG TPA: DNA adenine methylase [Acidimicrobiales bacterium]|nr:DNA adenine methylase [Acidimicrobiales bacterium]